MWRNKLFLRKLIFSNNVITKSKSSFFQARYYLTGNDLKAFQEQWKNLSKSEQMSIAINQRRPASAYVLISKGDFCMLENCNDAAIVYYKKAITMDKNFEALAQAKIAEIERHKKTNPTNKI